jgi:protein gp37
MGDLFHDKVPIDYIYRVLSAIAWAPQHTFIILTKRPIDMMGCFADEERVLFGIGGWAKGNHRQFVPDVHYGGEWPLPNLWLGVSVEDQKSANERIIALLRIKAAKYVVSYEPALGPVNFERIECRGAFIHALTGVAAVPGKVIPHNRIDWLIVGGETGPKARACDVSWIESAVTQCQAAGVPVFVKQLGRSYYKTSAGGQLRHYFPNDGRGANMAEWPEHLRVQEVPTT